MRSRISEIVYDRKSPCLDDVESKVHDVYAYVLAYFSLLSLVITLAAVVCIDGSPYSFPGTKVFQRTIVAAILVTGICAEALVAYGVSFIAKHLMNSLLVRSERRDDESQEDYKKRSSNFGFIFIMLAEEMVRPKYRWIGNPKSETLQKGRMGLKLALRILFLAFAVAEILLFLNTMEMIPHHGKKHVPLKITTTSFGGKGNSAYQVIGRQLIANRTSCIDHWIRFGKSDSSGACENTIFRQINETKNATVLVGTITTPTLPLIGAYCVRDCNELKLNGQSIGKLSVENNVIAETTFTASSSKFGSPDPLLSAGLPEPVVSLYAGQKPSLGDGNVQSGTHKLWFPIKGNTSGYEWVVNTTTRVTRAKVTYVAVPNGINISKVENISPENLALPARLKSDNLQNDFGDTIKNMISTPFGYFLRNIGTVEWSIRSAQQEAIVTMLAAIHVRSATNNEAGDGPDRNEKSEAYAVNWQVKKKNLPVLVLAIVVNAVALIVYLISRLYRSRSGNVITHDFVQLSSIFRHVVEDMAQPCAGSDRYRDSAENSLMKAYALGIRADETGRPVISPVGGVNMIHLTASSDGVSPWNGKSLPGFEEGQHQVRVGHEKKQL
jgi:hypothetical protein